MGKRLDVNYHRLRETLNSPFPLTQLGTLVQTEPSYGLGSRAIERTSENEPRYIRITDFGEDGIEPKHEFLTAYTVEPGYELRSDDILFARSGATVGKTYIHEDISEPAVFAGYCIRFQIDKSKVSPKFVYWWTKTMAYSRWTETIQRPSGQPNINKEEFKSCQIPLPPIEHQDRLVRMMGVARSERDAKLAEADALLNGINGFVLDALGIESPTTDPRKIFAVNPSDIRKGGSLNSDYYHPERMLALQALEDASDRLAIVSLGEVVSFERNQIKMPAANYLGLAHVQSNTGELNDSKDTANGTCFTYQTSDVLFARLRPYLNKVYRTEMDGCCSTEFHVLRVNDRESLSPDYLAAALRTRVVLTQTIHMMTGNTHPRLANDDVANLRIPIPTKEVQDAIVNEASRRREKVRRLRAEAKSVWEEAKRWFEEQLLR